MVNNDNNHIHIHIYGENNWSYITIIVCCLNINDRVYARSLFATSLTKCVQIYYKWEKRTLSIAFKRIGMKFSIKGFPNQTNKSLQNMENEQKKLRKERNG